MAVTKARLKRIETAARAARTAVRDDVAAADAFARRFPRTAEWITRYEDADPRDDIVRRVMARVNAGGFWGDQVRHWLLFPYARWAAVPERYDFPAKLLEFLADTTQ